MRSTYIYSLQHYSTFPLKVLDIKQLLILVLASHIISKEVPVRAVSTFFSPTHDFDPRNLVDDDEDTFFASEDVDTSPKDKALWIQIDVGLASVDRVQIKNRKDCCGLRTSNVELRVGFAALHESDTGLVQNETIPVNRLCGTFPSVATDGQLITIDCGMQSEDAGVPGSLVTLIVRDPSHGIINIAEIYVWGTSMKMGIIHCSILQILDAIYK